MSEPPTPPEQPTCRSCGCPYPITGETPHRAEQPPDEQPARAIRQLALIEVEARDHDDARLDRIALMARSGLRLAALPNRPITEDNLPARMLAALDRDDDPEAFTVSESALRKMGHAALPNRPITDDDEWHYTTERVTPEQVEALNKLLSMPWKESDLRLTDPDDEPPITDDLTREEMEALLRKHRRPGPLDSAFAKLRKRLEESEDDDG